VDEGAGDGAPNSSASVRLAISTPENNSRIWRNPEQPAALNRIALKAVVEPHVEQVVWYGRDRSPSAIDTGVVAGDAGCAGFYVRRRCRGVGGAGGGGVS
jgi:hypothetical protein